MVIVAVVAVLVLPVADDDEDEEVETMTVAVAVAPLVVKVVMLVVMVTVLPGPAAVMTSGGLAGLRAGALVALGLLSTFFASPALASGFFVPVFGGAGGWVGNCRPSIQTSRIFCSGSK